jgi:hypothetical protein
MILFFLYNFSGIIECELKNFIFVFLQTYIKLVTDVVIKLALGSYRNSSLPRLILCMSVTQSVCNKYCYMTHKYNNIIKCQ